MKRMLVWPLAAMSLFAAKAAHAVVFLAALPAVFAAGFGAIGVIVAVDSSKPPMDEQTAFIKYLRPTDVNYFVYWQKKGGYPNGDYSPNNDIAKGLINTRANLKKTMLAAGGSAEQFDAVYGTDAAPEFCAVSREAIAAQLLMLFGPEYAKDQYVRLHSSCKP